MRYVMLLASGVFAAATAGAQTLRKPDVGFDSTPHNIVAEMMQLAGVGPRDVVYDLGCGDGRTVIAAAKLGARGVCVDLDPQLVAKSRANAQAAGVADRIVFRADDMFETPLGDATVVTLYIGRELNRRLRPKLWRELEPGARVVSYAHEMEGWTPQDVHRVTGTHGRRKIYLWIMPVPRFEP